MFDLKNFPWNRHSQLSKRIHGRCFSNYFFNLFFILITHNSFAQNKETTDQAGRFNNSNLKMNTRYLGHPPEDSYTFEDFMKNLHGSYEVSLMGPRLLGASNETYNMYAGDVAPIQLYHVFQLGYQVNSDLQIGVKEAIVHNLVDGIIGNTGIIRNHSFEYYDPAIYFNLSNLFKIDSWIISHSFSFSMPFSEASQNAAKITSVTINQDWNHLITKDTSWTYGFSIYLNPQFYADPKPEGFKDRQTLYAAFGHNFGYIVSPYFNINTTTNFNIEHRSPDPQGFAHFGQALDDVFRITASITPQIFPLFMSLSGYCQFLFWNPAAETTILGAGFSIGF